jgi:hypothetical protein
MLERYFTQTHTKTPHGTSNGTEFPLLAPLIEVLRIVSPMNQPHGHYFYAHHAHARGKWANS